MLNKIFDFLEKLFEKRFFYNFSKTFIERENLFYVKTSFSLELKFENINI